MRNKVKASFFNLNHSKVKIYTYNAVKIALPKNHDQKSAKLLPQDTIFKMVHILKDKVQKASVDGVESLLKAIIKIFCDLK